MSAETELYAVLAAASGVTALVGNRIYPDDIPEDQAMPAIVFGRAGTEDVDTIGGQRIGEFATLQIAAWAVTRTTAKAVADAIRDALIAAGHNPANRASGYDGELGLHADNMQIRWFTTS